MQTITVWQLLETQKRPASVEPLLSFCLKGEKLRIGIKTG